MASKTLLITGVGIDGIGYQICKHILNLQKVARQSTRWRIILAQRDPQDTRALQASQELERLSAAVESTITAQQCDLSDFSSVRDFAQKLIARDQEIDTLVLNAGVVVNKYRETGDGNEVNYQVNHLGHFLLLHMLQERIKERVIFVNSSLHLKADEDLTLASLKTHDTTAPFNGMKRYAQSKLLTAYCLNFWHNILAQRHVKVVLASPGFVPSTSLSRDNSAIARFAMNWLIHYLPIARTPAQAGQSISALICGQEWSQLDNCYVDADLKEQRMHEDVYDKGHAEVAWNWSRSRCRLP